MCRHLAYLGPPRTLAELLTQPPGGLYRQAWAPRRQRRGTVNADGFGIGWYPAGPGEPPARYRRDVPIWADDNLPDLARAIRCGAVLAAVRCATPGTSHEASAAAPFGSGRWLFSHNGAVPDWTTLPAEAGTALAPAELLGLEARSDSALLWAMVGKRLRGGEPPAGALAAVARHTAAARPGARLTMLLTDGHTIAATRHGETLWYRTAPGEVLIASEPDDTSGWREVPGGSLLLATPGRVSVAPLRSAQGSGRDAARRFTLDDRLPPGHLVRALVRDVRAGLTRRHRTLPPKWFYDARGSALFEEITRLPEYYPTRAERQILRRNASRIAALTGARTLIEIGSGTSDKTRLLLDALIRQGTLRRYAPLDVSGSALVAASRGLARDYPDLRITATITDFDAAMALPEDTGPRLVAFLGGTIGNLDTDQRAAFLATLRRRLTGADALLLGADLVKAPGVLVRAYDDAQGVTAAFNKNVLSVLNRELGADFDPDAFHHRAVWDEPGHRVEMRLRSAAAQSVKIPGADLTLDLAEGEEVRTEISVKFRREDLAAELAAAGFAVSRVWTDDGGRFAVLLAVPADPPGPAASA